MKLSRYWLAGGLFATLAFGGGLWAAGTAPPPVAPPPRPAALVAVEEPIPLLPKNRTGVWRSVEISKDGNEINRHAIRFISGTELRWEGRRRAPGIDARGGARFRYAITLDGKLKLDWVANLEADGTERDRWDGNIPPQPLVLTILPLNRDTSAFQLVREDARRRMTLDLVFRREEDVPPSAGPLVPEHLTKIDRTIKKEPKYVNKPKYVLVAFGPEAKFKVWVVIDGDMAYIDRNGNGDLTEEGELCRPGSTEKNTIRVSTADIAYKLQGTAETKLSAGWFHDGTRTSGFVTLPDDDGLPRQTAGYNLLHLAPSPDQAAVIHLDSKVVTIRSSLRTNVDRQWRHAMPDANREAEVLFEVGTPGVGAGNKEFRDGAFATFTHNSTGLRNNPFVLPKQEDPVAEYEFTPLNPAERVKKVTVELSERLGQTEFVGKIKVPAGVKTGLDAAKVTLSFPNCPWGKVEPVTYTVDVIPKR